MSTSIFRSLDSVDQFGVFSEFRRDASSVPEFARYNLVYGWNYSGKTTLSRVFQTIERGKLHEDYRDGRFRLTMTDGATIDQSASNTRPVVRVFNRDFVLRNFREGTDMTGAEAIAVIGEENQDLMDQVGRLEDRKAGWEERVISADQQRQTLSTRLADDATATASVVNAVIGGRFDRRHLQTVIRGLPEDCWPLPISDVELDAKREEFRRARDFESVAEFQLDQSGSPLLLLRIRAALAEVATNRALDSLRESPEMERWVGAGLEFNSPGTRCGFCAAIVKKDRWEELQGHFSKAFKDLQRRLGQHRSSLSVLVFEGPANVEASLLPELRVDYRVTLKHVTDALAAAAAARDEILAVIDDKRDSLEQSQAWIPDLHPAFELRRAMRALNGIIRKHNKKVADSEKVREAARSVICDHYAVEYLKRSEVLQVEAKVDAFEVRARRLRKIRDRVTATIRRVEQRLAEASIAVQKINQNLVLLLPGNVIKAAKVSDAEFRFLRNGVPAKHMSEGERTAVALSYFLAKLEESEVSLSSQIVVLDDPISSLDSNHIYAVHSIIEGRLIGAAQLFIFTHNASFFGVTKDWMKSGVGQNRSEFFMVVSRVTTAGGRNSELIRLPRLLKRFKSDYHYTYHCLKEIRENPTPTVEELWGVPTMIRRLLEAYLGFIYPESVGWGQKLGKLLASEEMCIKVKKFADENSHAHSLQQALEVPDYIAHCHEIIDCVLEALERHNSDHIDSLNRECGFANP